MKGLLYSLVLLTAFASVFSEALETETSASAVGFETVPSLRSETAAPVDVTRSLCSHYKNVVEGTTTGDKTTLEATSVLVDSWEKESEEEEEWEEDSNEEDSEEDDDQDEEERFLDEIEAEQEPYED